MTQDKSELYAAAVGELVGRLKDALATLDAAVSESDGETLAAAVCVLNNLVTNLMNNPVVARELTKAATSPWLSRLMLERDWMIFRCGLDTHALANGPWMIETRGLDADPDKTTRVPFAAVLRAATRIGAANMVTGHGGMLLGVRPRQSDDPPDVGPEFVRREPKKPGKRRKAGRAP